MVDFLGVTKSVSVTILQSLASKHGALYNHDYLKMLHRNGHALLCCNTSSFHCCCYV